MKRTTLEITPHWSISRLAHGWYIWMLEKMKKLSYKDLIIALGVVVAAVIILTSVYFSDEKGTSVKVAPDRKVKPAAIMNTVVRKFSSHISL